MRRSKDVSEWLRLLAVQGDEEQSCTMRRCQLANASANFVSYELAGMSGRKHQNEGEKGRRSSSKRRKFGMRRVVY